MSTLPIGDDNLFITRRKNPSKYEKKKGSY